MFLHARKGHVEPLGKGCDRSVRTPELLQNAASGGVRERAERSIEVGLAILNHTVQYTTWVTACHGSLSARCVAGDTPKLTITAYRLPCGLWSPQPESWLSPLVTSPVIVVLQLLRRVRVGVSKPLFEARIWGRRALSASRAAIGPILGDAFAAQ